MYSCDDGHSIVFVAASENPAAPFYFIYFPEGETYRLYGEGTGNKESTKAAFEELKNLSEADVADLIRQTKAVSVGGTSGDEP